MITSYLKRHGNRRKLRFTPFCYRTLHINSITTVITSPLLTNSCNWPFYYVYRNRIQHKSLNISKPQMYLCLVIMF